MKKKKHNKRNKKQTEIGTDEIVSKLSAKKEKKEQLLIIIEHRIQKKEKEIQNKKDNGANTKRQEKEIRADKQAAHSVRYTIKKTERTIDKINMTHPTHKNDNAQPKVMNE